ncbi:MAG TPA: hemin uptake protein HemP [Burkholderiales bacterium]|nr:hemin uptake protein HemP [Burkholderiales bacterium]
MLDEDRKNRAAERTRVGASREPLPRTTSAKLLGGARELIIEHDGREYRLRVTQQGKLILTA